MKKIVIIIVAIGLFMFPSCKMLKTVQHEIKDSVSVDTSKVTKVNKDVSSVDTTKTKVSSSIETNTNVETIDTAIGLKKKKIGLSLDKNIKVDTIIENGELSLHVYTDDEGIQHIDCNSDSITLVFQKFKRVFVSTVKKYDSISTQFTQLSHKYDSVVNAKNIVVKSHTELIVKEKQLSWIGRVWETIKGFLSWVGLAAIIAFILWLVFKYFKR